MSYANRSGGIGSRTVKSWKSRRGPKLVSGTLGIAREERRLKRIREMLRKIASKQADTDKFVLVYQGVDDPDARKVAAVRKILAPANVEEVLPGTLRITGDKAKLEASAKTLKSWSLAPEGVFTDTRPAQGRFRSL